MYSFDSNYRVRYADVDQMGFMYYGNYAKLFEIGRVEALRNLGVRYKDLEDGGIWMPVYENNSKYLEPAKYDDYLTIRCILKEMPKVRIVFDTEILNENNKIIHKGLTTLVFIKADTQKITTCPQIIIEKLSPFFK
ncbi:acyl-CoA thioesterase [Lacihabitans sp. CCS-44]|jgi:acyl-CoA thioester hydrolase|uniref:acyl-CoA thioesterase n=1 Tax=Lacihabitans sp. CCS-44 TaxID=2487331 RepID=UPI0020CFB259|nr:thioesterase family protein [Lacihabitans sp. CCS-44]MCP9754266.1 acyl-CoA thioesterase [Lacihabitans sp. CCS-44]